MLNEESQTVYDVVKELAGEEDVYKVIDADEILEKLPNGMTKVRLSQIMRELKDGDYLSVKYFTPEEYCLLVVRGRMIPSNGDPTEEKAERAPSVKRAKDARAESKKVVAAGKGGVFLMAFLGGALGSAIVVAAAFIIIKFLL